MVVLGDCVRQLCRAVMSNGYVEWLCGCIRRLCRAFVSGDFADL